jgi:hypothetical protein
VVCAVFSRAWISLLKKEQSTKRVISVYAIKTMLKCWICSAWWLVRRKESYSS